MSTPIYRRKRRRRIDSDAGVPTAGDDTLTLLVPWTRYAFSATILMIALPFLGFMYIASVNLFNEMRLIDAGIMVQAEVTERRNETGFYELQYAFKSPDNPQLYRYSERLLSTGWALVTESDWLTSEKTGHISVLYLSANPNVNRPENTDEDKLKSNLISMIFFLLVSLYFFGWSALIYLNSRPKGSGI